MRISSKTDYALRTLVDLAINRESGVSHISEIAGRQGIPEKFLVQILLILKGAGLVGSRRGREGGYYMIKPPGAISIASVVRLTDRALLDRSPVEERTGAVGRASHTLWREVGAEVEAKLESISIQQLCDRVVQLSGKGREYVI